MLNLAKVGTIEELNAAVAALPESTPTLSPEAVNRIKALALEELKAVADLPKINWATLHIKANAIGNWRQTEIQVSGRWVEPKAE